MVAYVRHELWRCKAVANDFHAPMDGIGTSITGSGVRLLPLPFYTNGKLSHLLSKEIRLSNVSILSFLSLSFLLHFRKAAPLSNTYLPGISDELDKN
jgi:hypothetical protein